MFSKFYRLRKWQLGSFVLLCSLLWSLAYIDTPQAKALVTNGAYKQYEKTAGGSQKIQVTDYWKAPIAITGIRLGDQELRSGAPIDSGADWINQLSIEGVNRSEKPISYISYAVDFEVTGRDSLYRVKVVDGSPFGLPPELRKGAGLQILKGQRRVSAIASKAWECSLSLIAAINESKAKVVRVELFVEEVGFKDDTLWTFGAWMRRSKENPSVFENVERGTVAQTRGRMPLGLTRNFLTRGVLTPNYTSTCCTHDMTFKAGSCRASRVTTSCSGCPPNGPQGPNPTTCLTNPMKEVNSCSGQGPDQPDLLPWVTCN